MNNDTVFLVKRRRRQSSLFVSVAEPEQIALLPLGAAVRRSRAPRAAVDSVEATASSQRSLNLVPEQTDWTEVRA